jgi:hypothetical protein
LLVCKVRLGLFGAEAQPASNKEAKAKAGTNKRRIGVILKIKVRFNRQRFSLTEPPSPFMF